MHLIIMGRKLKFKQHPCSKHPCLTVSGPPSYRGRGRNGVGGGWVVLLHIMKVEWGPREGGVQLARGAPAPQACWSSLCCPPLPAAAFPVAQSLCWKAEPLGCT